MWKTGADSRWWKRITTGILSLFGLLILVGVFLTGNLAQQAPWVQPEGIYFIEADAYSRMTRVAILAGVEPWHQRAEASTWPWVRWHEFENAPQGIRPHTTAAMDWAILALWVAQGRGDLDRAGWWIGPVLGVLFLVAAWGWSGSVFGRMLGHGDREGKEDGGVRGALPFRWGMLFLLAASPMLWHGWAFGRPDHQALVLLWVGLAWMAEVTRWREGGGRSVTGGVLTGFFWSLAFWVSWFEPLVLFAWATLLGVTRVWFQSGDWRGEAWVRGVALAGAGVVALIEGPPRAGLAPEWREPFLRWAGEIGELQGVLFWQSLPEWTGWVGLLVPCLLLGKIVLGGIRGDGGGSCAPMWWWLAGWILLAALASWHLRWGYFLVLMTILAIPWAWGCWRARWLAVVFFVAGLWPWAAAVERIIEPNSEGRRGVEQRVAEARALREIALALRDEKTPGAVVAPWWLTPPLVYWSGRNGVGGSSHQSLPGIVRSAEFFLSRQDGGNDRHGDEFGRSLVADGVLFVVVGDQNQIRQNSRALLGLEEAAELHHFDPGEGWEFWGRTPYFRVWRAR